MGPVVGGVVGGLAVVGLVGAAAFFYLRRRQAGPAARAGRHDAILDPGAEKYGTYGGEPAPGSPGFVPGMTGGYGAESRPMLYVRSISCLRPALLGGALRAVRTEPERPADYDTNLKARNDYQAAVRDAAAAKRNNHSERCSLNYKMEIARAVRLAGIVSLVY